MIAERNIQFMIEKYREQLERDTEAFWVDNTNIQTATEWCKDNLDNNCWFYESGFTADCYFIKGHENIMAFKLRWS